MINYVIIYLLTYLLTRYIYPTYLLCTPAYVLFIYLATYIHMDIPTSYLIGLFNYKYLFKGDLNR